MGTNCKLIYGYTDHTGYWNTTDEYYRHYDGYTEAILPLLKEHKANLITMNECAKYDSHKFEKIEEPFDYGNTNYMYFIDISNHSKIKLTILSEDIEFYKKYGISNYKVEWEGIL